MRIFSLALFLFSGMIHADSIDNYMHIAMNIPKMEMKADPQAQAWARSARHVLSITSESILETLNQANEVAKSQGNPLFCLPRDAQLDSGKLDNIIQQTYQEMANQPGKKSKMTVSQVAWIGIAKRYPCQNNSKKRTQMAHVSALLGQN